ncbi:MAG: hypothetical protein HRU15_05025 [Planctomycetes bacterium]|nr:hypothetical protein [Planctomycetota bacterium]
MNGKEDQDVTQAERRAAIEKGFTEFTERYGKSKALYGISFETQDLSPKYTECSLDQFRKSFGTLKEFRKFMKGIAPDLELFHYLGGKNIHDQYFHNGAEIISGWEASVDIQEKVNGKDVVFGKGVLAQPWNDYLAHKVNGLWTEWQRNPDELNKDDINTILTYQSDDYHIFDTYYQNPRAMAYWDMEASQKRSDLIDTRKAMVWNTFYEAYIGLTKDNWWYQKVWVAPDFNPAGPLALEGWTQAMFHRDRDLLMFGAWNNKGAGHEMKLRKMAKAFRSLPPAELKDAVVTGDVPVLVRSAVYKGQTYINCINHTPFAQTLSVNGKSIELTAYSMQTIIEQGSNAVQASGQIAARYKQWIAERLLKFKTSSATLKKLRSKAQPAAYGQHLARAQQLYDQKQFRAADTALGFGLQEEIDLRLSIIEPRVLSVPKLQSALDLNADLCADLDAWPKAAADWQSDAAHIGTHLFFPAQWNAEKDLSARIRCGHDGEKVYFAIAVRDNKLSPKDGCSLYFSGKNYLKYASHKEPYEKNIGITIPKDGKEHTISGAYGATGKVVRTKSGYTAVLSMNIADMPLNKKNIGFLLSVADDDFNKNLTNNTWARKQVLLYPNDPNFAYWADARTCAQLRLE